MANYRLLLVEDDFDVAEMLVMYFEAMQYQVLHADNGKDGIEIAKKQFPDLILLDVMLPDMDGYEICYRLRNMSMTKFIPTIFLTQKDERADKVKGLELGADDYITKPFDIDELRLRVEGAIRRATRDSLHEQRSGLPTGSFIDDERERRKSDPNTQELRFHLHGFTEYNDVYGFMAGNEVLFHAGKVIRETLQEAGRSNAFVGIEKDDFVVMTSLEDTQSLEDTIRSKFREHVATFYAWADSERGGLQLTDGQGAEIFVPMMSLTTGAPDNITDQPKTESSDDASLLEW